MSTRVPPESVATVFSQMWRTVSVFSDAFASASTSWMEDGLEGLYAGSPRTVQRCARLEAEIVQLRKRLGSTETTVLPIVKSSDTGGLSCEFMFAARDSRRSSATSLQALPVRQYAQDVQEVDITDAVLGAVDVDDDTQVHARTELLQVVDPEGDEEAWMAEVVFDADDEDSLIVTSPSEDIVLMNEVVPVTDVMLSPVLPDWEEPFEVRRIIAGDVEEVVECIEEVQEDGQHEGEKEFLDAIITPVVVVDAVEYEGCKEDEDDKKERINVKEDQQEVLATQEEEPIEELISPATIGYSGLEDSKQPVGATSVGFYCGVCAEDFPASIGALIQGSHGASLLIATIVEFGVGIADFLIPSILFDARVQSDAGLPSPYGHPYNALPLSQQLLLAAMAPRLFSLPRSLSFSPFSFLAIVFVDLSKLSQEEAKLLTGASISLVAPVPAASSASPRRLGFVMGSSSSQDLKLADTADIMDVDVPSGVFVALVNNLSVVYDPTVSLSPCSVEGFHSLGSLTSLIFLSSSKPPVYDQVSCSPPDHDDPLITIIDIFLYLLLGALLCSMLSSPAFCLCFVLWLIFGTTTVPLPTTTSHYGSLR
ncbi:hypothetical protein C8Q79DRAFT_1008156 [Trametes meyenii]|nr:hypothetical protein C8Q79DRAFT_1008156 [Trametes meyenii]